MKKSPISSPDCTQGLEEQEGFSWGALWPSHAALSPRLLPQVRLGLLPLVLLTQVVANDHRLKLSGLSAPQSLCSWVLNLKFSVLRTSCYIQDQLVCCAKCAALKWTIHFLLAPVCYWLDQYIDWTSMLCEHTGPVNIQRFKVMLLIGFHPPWAFHVVIFWLFFVILDNISFSKWLRHS